MAGAGSAFGGTITAPTDEYCNPNISSGQLCPRSGQVAIPTPVPAGVTSVTVTWDGPGFCSDGRLLIFVGGAAAGKTSPWNGPTDDGNGKGYVNDGTATIELPADGKPHTLSWQAEGRHGGCNDQALVQFTGTVIVSFDSPGYGSIDGTVLDTDNQPVAGVEVRADGIDGTFGGARSRTNGQGKYVLLVKEGHYQVTPSKSVTPPRPPGGAQPAARALKFEPDDVDRAVKSDETATADFTLDSGLKVSLTLSLTQVVANGLTVVSGTVETTEGGLPDAGVTVSLEPKNDVSPELAVTSGARATLCSSSGTRIWPGGTLTDPDGHSVDVVTDQYGRYSFTLDVGTVPGRFELDAWARDSSGRYMTEPGTSADQTLTIEPNGSIVRDEKNPTTLAQMFISQLKQVAIPGAAAAQGATTAFGKDNTAAGIAAAFAANGSKFPGLAFAAANAASKGPVVIVYLAAGPPSVDSSGVLLPAALVLAPGEYVGGLPKADGTQTPKEALSNALSVGNVATVPTFPQWAGGETLAAWTLVPNTMTVYSGRFEYYGWPYPNPRTGACS